MTLNYVQLTCDLYDGSGNPITQGVASFAPTTTLTDPTDNMFIPTAPILVNFKPGITPIVKLLATDNAAVNPGGWGWSVTFVNVPGNPATFNFFLPFSGGASQNLSDQAPVTSAATMTAYLPLPSGTAISGQVPVATGSGSGSAWANVATNPLTGVGDLPYGGNSGALTRLPADTSNVRKFLRELSSGGVGQAPAWDTIQAGDVPALPYVPTASLPLALGSGGTGQTSQQAALDALAGAQTANRVLAGNGTHITLRTLAYADLPLTEYWQPSDDGFLGFNSDPSAASGGGVLIATNLYLMRIIPRVNQTISTLWFAVNTIGVNSTGTAFVGLYSSAGGAPLSTSTDCSATFAGTTGWKGINLQVAQAVIAGNIYYAAVLSNLSTTQVSLQRQLNSNLSSPQVSANVSTLRWAQQVGFSATTMGSVTLTSNVATAFNFVVGWS